MKYDGEIITSLNNIFTATFYASTVDNINVDKLRAITPVSLDSLIYTLLMDKRKTDLLKTGCLFRVRNNAYLANKQTMNLILKGRSARKIVLAFLVRDYITKKYPNLGRLEKTILEIEQELKEEINGGL